MLRFLLGTPRTSEKPVIETQREVFSRLIADLNTAIEGLPTKPKVTIDPNTGRIELDLPEHLPDEALALPAPDAEGGDEADEKVEAETVEAKAA